MMMIIIIISLIQGVKKGKKVLVKKCDYYTYGSSVYSDEQQSKRKTHGARSRTDTKLS